MLGVHRERRCLPSSLAATSVGLIFFMSMEGEAKMEHDAQVVLALGISVTLSLIAWGWARRRLRRLTRLGA